MCILHFLYASHAIFQHCRKFFIFNFLISSAIEIIKSLHKYGSLNNVWLLKTHLQLINYLKNIYEKSENDLNSQQSVFITIFNYLLINKTCEMLTNCDYNLEANRTKLLDFNVTCSLFVRCQFEHSFVVTDSRSACTVIALFKQYCQQ